jgi:hypothetical protein
LTAPCEVPSLDFKQVFADQPRAWLELEKDIVCMANYGGGLLLFGVCSDGTWVGLPASLARLFDPATVIAKVQRHARSARITVEYVEVTHYRHRFGLMRVHAATHITLFDMDGDYPDENNRVRKAFYRGVVYSRGAGGNCAATQLDLDRLVEIAANRKVSSLLARIQTIAFLPERSQLVAQDPKQPTKGYVLVSSGEGTPVRIVPDESGAALTLSEVMTKDQPFSSLDAEVMGQVRQWAQRDRRHRVSRATLIQWYLDRALLTVADDVMEFCFLSATANFGYPMYWAAQMSRNRLRECVVEQLQAGEYPTINALPYVVGCFFWSERAALLQAEGLTLPQTARDTARRLCRLDDFDLFRHEGRLQARTAGVDGKRLVLGDLLNGPLEAVQRLFEVLLKKDSAGRCRPGEKQLANQLDLFLHARARARRSGQAAVRT